MHNRDTSTENRQPWNKGKFTGVKPPLRPKHIWSIRSSKKHVSGRLLKALELRKVYVVE
jgi:hypothetical protein